MGLMNFYNDQDINNVGKNFQNAVSENVNRQAKLTNTEVKVGQF